jgi:ribosomal protein S18 acetylase RimI-like enzyme
MLNADEATIRSARFDDYAQACRLSDALDELHREHLPWMFKTPEAQPRSEAYFSDLLNREDSAVFVADAGHVVGIAFGLLRTAPEFPVFRQQRWGVLDGLVVDPTWRRRGIGTRLTHAMEKWAIELGAPCIELNVYEFNTEARRFYEALGYLPFSTKLRKPGSPGAA